MASVYPLASCNGEDSPLTPKILQNQDLGEFMKTGRKRNHQVIIRLNDIEHSFFKSNLEKTGLTQREYILDLILQKPIFGIHELDGVEEQIRRIGVNINQISRKVNVDSNVLKKDLEIIQEEQLKIWRLLKQLRVVPR